MNRINKCIELIETNQAIFSLPLDADDPSYEYGKKCRKLGQI